MTAVDVVVGCEIGLGRYEAAFVANEIDFDVIRSLTDADLRELGVAAVVIASACCQAIARLDEQRTPTLSPPVSQRRPLGLREHRLRRWRTPPAYRDVLRSGGFDGAE